jgi:cytochrome P450
MNAAPISQLPVHVPPSLAFDVNYYDQPGGREDPHRAWKRLHSYPDIFYTPHYGGHWIVTRYNDQKAIFEDHERFSSWRNAIPDYPRSFRLAPIETDPPLHERYKRLLVPTFAPANIKDLEGRARALTVSLIDGFLGHGGCEFVSAFSLKMPIGIFMTIAGLPEPDRPKLLQWVEDKVRNADEKVQAAAAASMVEYARMLVQERRQRPGSDLFSKIANVEYEGEKLSEDDVVGFFALLLFAGLDTVSSSLGFIARFLAENPPHRHQLQANPGLIPKAIEELLRRFGVSSPARILAQDTVFNGVQMKKNDMVLLPVTLAGLDERVFERPFEVEFNRPNAATHLTFGTGIHRCLGSFLARTELKVFLEEWLTRIPEYQITPGERVITSAGVVNGTIHLPLSWPS